MFFVTFFREEDVYQTSGKIYELKYKSYIFEPQTGLRK